MGSKNDRVLDKLPTGFRDRTWVSLKLMSRAAVSVAKKNLPLRGAVEAVPEDHAVALAERLLDELDGLKGLVLKLGQMVSYLDHSLPPRARRILARLQDSTRPLAFGPIDEVVIGELGAPAQEVFEDFEPLPFAAASIGQVHRARFAGEPVAVKVQYPGIDRLLEQDLRTVGTLARVMLAMSPLDGGGLVRELHDRMLEECDYTREADHLRRFAVALGSMPGISIPRVFDDVSARRVLTTELVDRRSFDAFAQAASQAERDRAGVAIYTASMTSIFRHAAYNADPHPGNYLFAPDGDVTLLDFGCVKHFAPDFIARWKRLARSILAGEPAGFRDALLDAGLVGRPRGFDFDHQLQAMRVLYRPMLSARPFAFTHEYVAELHDTLIFENRNKMKVGLAPDWLFVNRLQWGMFSVLAQLRATAQWGDIFRAALDSNTVPLADAPVVTAPTVATAPAERRQA